MLKRALAVAAIALPAAAIAQTEWEDRPITPEERAQVIVALEQAGCTNPTKIERDDDGYEADNAKCATGVFDIDLDRDFRIIDRDRED